VPAGTGGDESGILQLGGDGTAEEQLRGFNLRLTLAGSKSDRRH